jgi:hypothetical protein
MSHIVIINDKDPRISEEENQMINDLINLFEQRINKLVAANPNEKSMLFGQAYKNLKEKLEDIRQ